MSPFPTEDEVALGRWSMSLPHHYRILLSNTNLSNPSHDPYTLSLNHIQASKPVRASGQVGNHKHFDWTSPFANVLYRKISIHLLLLSTIRSFLVLLKSPSPFAHGESAGGFTFETFPILLSTSSLAYDLKRPTPPLPVPVKLRMCQEKQRREKVKEVTYVHAHNTTHADPLVELESYCMKNGKGFFYCFFIHLSNGDWN